MEDHAYIGELIAGVAYLIAGFRMLRLARRTGELPERLLGGSFSLIGISYLLYTVPIVLPDESLWTPFSVAGRLSFDLGIIPFVMFTRVVFRPNAPWALWIVSSCAVLIAVGVTASLLGGDAEGMTIGHWWFWFEWVGYATPSVWMSVEAFVAYANAKKRMRIGLCDALVVNRFLLWAFHGLFGVAACLSVITMYSDYATTHVFSTGADRLLGSLELGSIATLWLVFFPPRFYQRWIENSAPTSLPNRSDRP